MAIIVNLRNLSLTFGTKVIFDNAELNINKGDRIGLIGLNGQGKSTLFKILQGEVEPDTTTPFTYDRSKEPFDIFLIPQTLNINEFKHLTIDNYYLAFYPQLLKVQTELEKDYSNEKLLTEFETLGGWEIQNNYVNYLKGFDLHDHHRTIDTLSGGEQRKMALSIGLSSPAEFLLWDEPTNHLDIETIERFEDELIKSNKTYMIISHDRYLLNHTTDKICHIEHGKINSFKGTYLDYLTYLDEKEAELQKNLEKLENRHRRELAWMRQGIKARGTRSKKRVEGYHNIQDGISSIKNRSKKVVSLEMNHSGRKSKKLVELQEGAFNYADKEIFHDLNIIVAKKDKIALIGPNGAGKSTLINIFQEKLALTSGKQRNAQDLKVVVFDQHRASLDDKLTPKEIVGDGTEFVEMGDGRKKHIHAYLESFLFTSNQINRPVATLSGGERNRLQLAMFMKQAADLWVFDEPTNDLDIETIEILEKELKSYDAAVIIIGHDRAFLDNTCNTTWLIHDKSIEVFEGGYTQVAPYLHAIELEKSLLGSQKSKKKENTDKTDSKIKLTHNEKKRLEVIESEIHNAEEALANLEKELAEFDYNNMTQDKKVLFEKMNTTKKVREKKVENLFAEWELLEAKVALL